MIALISGDCPTTAERSAGATGGSSRSTGPGTTGNVENSAGGGGEGKTSEYAQRPRSRDRWRDPVHPTSIVKALGVQTPSVDVAGCWVAGAMVVERARL